jgi:Flp pilus assembly protein TadD
MVATLPFTLLLLDLWPLRRLSWRSQAHRAWRVWWWLILEKSPLIVLSCFALAATFFSQRRVGAVATLADTSLGLRLQNATVSYSSYLLKVVWPSDLTAYYPYPDGFSSAAVAGAGILLVSLTAGAVLVFRRAPSITIGWSWYLGTLVPVIGIVPVGGHGMADRFTYVPAVGLYLAIVGTAGVAVRAWRLPRRVFGAVGIFVVVAFAIVAREQVWTWQDSRTMWGHAVSVSPHNARAYSNLGAALLEERRADEAADAFRRAVQLQPSVPRLRRNLGLALLRAGRSDAARAEFEEALRIDPSYADGHAALGDVLAEQGDVAAAIRHYQQAIALDPAAGTPQMNLAMTLAQIGRLQEALPYAQAAVRLEPERHVWRLMLAFLLRDLGQSEEAIRELTVVLSKDPGNPQALRELRELQQK